MQDLAQLASREWLETNGLGGFASGTLAGINTRRYHALLTAAVNPPIGRQVLVSQLEETVINGVGTYELSANQYGDVVHPRGFELISDFTRSPWPTWTYTFGKYQLRKSVFMVHGSNTTVVSYELLGDLAKPLTLELRPLITGRDYHSLTHENPAIAHTLTERPNAIEFSPYSGIATIHFSHNAAAVEPQGNWYRNFRYNIERDRGLDDTEDLFNPFLLRFTIDPGHPAIVILSTDPVPVADYQRLREGELARRAHITHSVSTGDKFAQSLALAANQFIVRRGQGHTVIAGYPWFTDWGRDTMISLPGLTLFDSKQDVARDILRNFASAVSEGMLPNRFPDAGEAPEYNTVDATLWLFEAIRAYVHATHDLEFAAEIYPTLLSIVDHHIRGTRYGIRMIDNGLLEAGEPGVQLTWMDARVDGRVITPRYGKPVEIQALWYNALMVMTEYAMLLGDHPNHRRFKMIAQLLSHSFNHLFWNPEANCLYDVVNGTSDARIRPNQIFAVSLPHSMLSQERALAVVETVQRELLTPYGLRTLSPRDPAYIGSYAGNSAQRDSAYHQGTTWPWLLGPFITAYVKVRGKTDSARAEARQMLVPLESYLNDQGQGQLPEIFDGDVTPTSIGKGCPAQAWSVAEIFRCLMQDVLAAPLTVDGESSTVPPHKRVKKKSASVL